MPRHFRLLLALGTVAVPLAMTSTVAAAAVDLGDASPIGPATARQATVSSQCPQATSLDAPHLAQEQAMLCLVNETRGRYGLPPLSESEPLRQAAIDKGRDLIECNEFSHTACGREFSHWIRETGYLSTECWRAGENLAWGVDGTGTVGAIFRAWMNSPSHRENILGNFGEIGIDLRVGELGGLTGVHLWVQQFGTHCV